MLRIERWIRRATLAGLAAGLLVLPCDRAQASGISTARLEVDFTKADAARGLARWSLPDRILCGPEGLGWDGPPRSSYDASIHVTKPLAIGHAWWAATNASIRILLSWSGPEVAEIHGQLHLRYSPDLASWSHWIEVPRYIEKNDRTKHEHRLQLDTPGPHARGWYALLRRHRATQPPPAAQTQSAAAAWIERERPGYLARVMPFFGYMQFRYDVGFKSRHRLARMNIAVTYVTPGSVHPPRVPGVDARKLWDAPWNHRAPGVRAPEQTASAEATTRAVLRAALTSRIRRAAVGDGELPVKALTLCERTALSADLLDLDLGGALPALPPFGAAAAAAWADFVARNGESRLIPGDLHVGREVRYAQRYHALSLLAGGRPERDTPEQVWLSFHGRQRGSLGLLWVTEPGVSADATQAIVHIGRAWSPTGREGHYLLLTKKDGAWAVTKTIPSGL